MDYAACNVVYVDRAAKEDKLVKRESVASSSPPSINLPIHAEGHAPARRGSHTLEENLQTLLATFSEVHLCSSGKSCVSKLSELNQASIVDLIPTLVLIDIPYEDQIPGRSSPEIRTPSPSTRLQVDGFVEEPDIEETYGLTLLQWISSEIQYQSLSKLIVPVAVVALPSHNSPEVPSRQRSGSVAGAQIDYESFATDSKSSTRLAVSLDQVRTMQYLDVGAMDVLTSPLLHERLPSLGIHAYRAHRDASKDQRALLDMKRGRKRSWVGVDDQKPYAYLREAMVSGLMDGICTLGGDDEPMGHIRISVASERRQKIAEAIGSWLFSAHDFTDDELLHAALLMLQHALTMPELERWRISTENLTGFLVASRSAYNAFVPYHNFRHVVDVLQAIFHFLVKLGRLPPYPYTSSKPAPPSPIAALIRPFDALTLLITAIGHDVGHPGVNNAFLVTLNAPLAQLYNDRSVLESFHCAAYSQILRRHWPAAFQGGEMRQLMINSILATDMGLHFDYMKRLGFLQEKLHENGGTDGWNGRLLEEQRTLACSLLIKCADISNIARSYDVAARWTMILTDEFARQASMEQDLGIPTALFAVPVREIVELGKSQLGFMNMFALPLFQGVTDVMPGMEFCVDELYRNSARWEEKIAEEQARAKLGNLDSKMMDGMFSPRTMSIATPSDASHQKPGSAISSGTSNTDSSVKTKTMLRESPFAQSKHIPGESTGLGNHHSMPEISTTDFVPRVSNDSFPSQVSPDSNSRRSSKPLQLQLSYATASAPGHLDHPAQDHTLNGDEKEHRINGMEVQPSLVTDAIIIDSATAEEIASSSKTENKQRKSDITTESSHSAGGDWTSQATSATTNKLPLSPSTQATSITSDDPSDNLEKGATPTYGSPLANKGFLFTNSTTGKSEEIRNGHDGKEGLEGKGVLRETVRNLKKRPSRFRMNMNFWKRSKSSSPPKERRATGGAQDEAGSSHYP